MSHKSLIRQILSLLLIAMAIATLNACYKENPISESTFEDYEIPTIIGVNPENGAMGIDRNTDIGVAFSGAMDTASLTQNLYLTGGSGMRQWMDSLSGIRGGDRSGDCDQECMIRWLDSISYRGQLHWNQNLDSCTFEPDSMLMADEDHMLFITGPVRGITGAPMVCDTFEYGGYMSTFHTAASNR